MLLRCSMVTRGWNQELEEEKANDGTEVGCEIREFIGRDDHRARLQLIVSHEFAQAL
jgi:hypothetical protein